MLRIRSLALVVVVSAGCGWTTTAQAGGWHRVEPPRFVNHLGRCLGLGWSDGYHAYGSRNSWLPPVPAAGPHVHSHFRPSLLDVTPLAVPTLPGLRDPQPVPADPQPVEQRQSIPYNPGR